MDERDKELNALRRELAWNENDPKEAGTYLVAWENELGLFYSVCDYDGDAWIPTAAMRGWEMPFEIVAWKSIREYVF